MTLRTLIVLLLIAVVTLFAAVGCSDSDDTKGTEITKTPLPTQSPTLTPEPTAPAPTPSPTEPATASDNPIVVMSTNFGDITLELYQDKLPITVENFLKYVRDDFYNNVVFHRIADDFMIQAGMQDKDGKNRIPTYPPIKLETHPEVTHVDGAISMARTSDPNSATAQFFICDGPQHFLDKNYAAFGVVIDGIEVVREIAALPHDNSNPAGGGVPLEQVVINSITVQ